MDILNYANQLNQRVGEPQALPFIRSFGRQALSKLGWPTKRLENWRYSPVARLQAPYLPQMNLTELAQPDVNKLLAEHSSPAFSAIVCFNGMPIHVAAELEHKIEFRSLRQALECGELDSNSWTDINDSLEALNISFFDQGAYLKIKERVVLEKPIHCLHFYSSSDSNPLFQSRFGVFAGSGSSSAIIASHLVVSEHETAWLNPSTSLQLDSKAHLTFVHWNEAGTSLQNTYRLAATVGDEAYLHCLHGALTEGWNRSDISICCQGSGAEILLHGVGLSRKQGHLDQQTKLIFKGIKNKAEQICKNLLEDQSRAVFNGRININPGAQKTDSSQLHQSLLLSSEAEVDTKPELEIFADDVKATHGATIGQLNTDEVFYFQSRGISKERARGILCIAFLLDLCERISDVEMQNYLKKRVESYWAKGSP